MAILTSIELGELRSVAARNSASVPWTKTQVNAALQAIEDRMQLSSTKTLLSNDIDGVAPGVFSTAQKQLLFSVWCVSAARRMGVR